jgi:hypothetical protein
MIFQSHSKGLRLVVIAGRKEVDKSAGIPVVVNHPQKEIRFDTWRYETDDEDEIVWLKRHRLFSEVASAPGKFWVFVQPRNFQAELESKEAELAKYKEKFGEIEPAAPSSPSVQTEAAPAAPVSQASQEPAAPKAPFCDSCASKGVSHKKDCPKNPKNIQSTTPVTS